MSADLLKKKKNLDSQWESLLQLIKFEYEIRNGGMLVNRNETFESFPTMQIY